MPRALQRKVPSVAGKGQGAAGRGKGAAGRGKGCSGRDGGSGSGQFGADRRGKRGIGRGQGAAGRGQGASGRGKGCSSRDDGSGSRQFGADRGGEGGIGRVQGGSGKGSPRKIANARRTPFESGRNVSSSQVPPLPTNKRSYNATSFAAASRYKSPATGFGVYSDLATGTHVKVHQVRGFFMEEGGKGLLPVIVLSMKEREKKRRPTIVFLHSTNKCKEWLMPLLKGYASRGYIAVPTDSRYHGERATNMTTYQDVSILSLAYMYIRLAYTEKNFTLGCLCNSGLSKICDILS
ncbi:hypothetical protein BC332_21368 [Capsicum chinense]|nr:hypothetical protein BC332_21368 [Capsicum chinense]